MLLLLNNRLLHWIVDIWLGINVVFAAVDTQDFDAAAVRELA